MLEPVESTCLTRADEADTLLYQLYQLCKERIMEMGGVLFCAALMVFGVIGAFMQKARGNW